MSDRGDESDDERIEPSRPEAPFSDEEDVAGKNVPQQHRSTDDPCSDHQLPATTADLSDAIRFTTPVCTLWYRAPELLLGAKVYDPAPVDVWSIACVLGELILQRPPFTAASETQQLCRILTVTGSPDFGGAVWKTWFEERVLFWAVRKREAKKREWERGLRGAKQERAAKQARSGAVPAEKNIGKSGGASSSVGKTTKKLPINKADSKARRGGGPSSFSKLPGKRPPAASQQPASAAQQQPPKLPPLPVWPPRLPLPTPVGWERFLFLERYEKQKQREPVPGVSGGAPASSNRPFPQQSGFFARPSPPSPFSEDSEDGQLVTGDLCSPRGNHHEVVHPLDAHVSLRAAVAQILPGNPKNPDFVANFDTLMNFIRQIFEVFPDRRLGVAELVAHPFLAGPTGEGKAKILSGVMMPTFPETNDWSRGE